MDQTSPDNGIVPIYFRFILVSKQILLQILSRSGVGIGDPAASGGREWGFKKRPSPTVQLIFGNPSFSIAFIELERR